MPRVKGSWRDKKKGDCWARTGKGGGTYVVCEGSKGQAGVYKKGKKGKKGGSKGEYINPGFEIANKAIEKKYSSYSLKELNDKLDSMDGTSSQGGGTKADKIRKIHKNGGRLKLTK